MSYIATVKKVIIGIVCKIHTTQPNVRSSIRRDVRIEEHPVNGRTHSLSRVTEILEESASITTSSDNSRYIVNAVAPHTRAQWGNIYKI